MIENITLVELIIVLSGFALLITTSGKLIEYIFSKLSNEKYDVNKIIDSFIWTVDSINY